jgi:hypothetical protein
METKMKQKVKVIGSVFLLLLYVENANSVEFEKMGTAISKVLGTTKAFKTTVKRETAYYSKGKDGKPLMYAFVEKGLYEPNCTHTWVIGVDAKTAQVKGVRVVEMSCPHAFPTNKPSFLEQFLGKGPADLKALKTSVHTIAKATATSNLATDAVARSIAAVSNTKGK